MTGALTDRLLGSVVGVFALAYIAEARAIEDSLLADAVGAGGVPLAAGIVLLVAAVALVVKSFFEVDPRGAVSTEAPPARIRSRSPRHLLISAALVGVLVAHVLLLPLLGYIVSVSLMVLAVALLAGAPRRWPLLPYSVLAGVALWAMFELALQIRMPAGALFR